MKRNRITVFNKAVDKHLEDLSYFEDLLTKHYLKFSYGYNIIATDSVIELVDDIECVLKDKSIAFILTFSKKVTKLLLNDVSFRSSTVEYSDRFAADIISDGKEIRITIRKRRDSDPEEFDEREFEYVDEED